MSYLRRRVIAALLTANAIRPPTGYRAGTIAFLPGWLVSELAPHLLGLTAVDTTVAALRGRAGRGGLALAAVTAGGLVHLIRQSQQARDVLEQALVDGLGADYAEQLDALPAPADLATPWRNVARPLHFADPRVRVERDLPFADFGSRGQLDVFRPVTGEVHNAPVLLQVHGGGWTVGRKDQQGQPLMYHLAAKGWVCVAINYRLAPRDPFPAQIQDVKQAIAWVKEHIAAYGGDPSYVAITGGSAGGHLAALAAVTPNRPEFQPGFEDADTSVSAAVPIYGVYDFAGASGLRGMELMRDTFLGPRILQKTWREDAASFEAASPLLQVTDDAPDFFVIHGANDSLVPVGQARAFVERLRATSKRSVVYADLPGTQHAFEVFHSIRSAHTVRAIDRYLHWHWNSTKRPAVVDEHLGADALQTRDSS